MSGSGGRQLCREVRFPQVDRARLLESGLNLTLRFFVLKNRSPQNDRRERNVPARKLLEAKN